MRVKYEDLLEKFQRILESRGFSGKHAKDAATVFANNSLDGVYSHGVNRFPRVVEYLDKGEIDSAAIATCESSMGAIERWNGHRGFGPSMQSWPWTGLWSWQGSTAWAWWPLEIITTGCGGVSYGWQAADKGCIGICWSNTMPNMPAWGGRDRKIGNNPFIMSIPRSNGKHAVIDCAVSQFSYGNDRGGKA
mgnify:CR=1 FL=1